MTMPFDEALRQSGPLLAAWRLDTDRGEVVLSLFSLAGGGAKQLAVQRVHPDDQVAAARPLREADIPIGSYDRWCDFAWLRGEECFTVWGSEKQIFRTDANTIHPEKGPDIPRSEVVSVVAWIDADWIERGVSLELASGSRVRVAAEVPFLQDDSPSWNDVLYSSHWAAILARDLSRLLGVPFHDRILS